MDVYLFSAKVQPFADSAEFGLLESDSCAALQTCTTDEDLLVMDTLAPLVSEQAQPVFAEGPSALNTPEKGSLLGGCAELLIPAQADAP